jgi:membrane-associated protease RseP (regulator of RpoE activity)
VPDHLLPTAVEFQEALAKGVMYTLALLGILGAHEMGHYIVARHYKVQTSLPYFIPLPVSILGTLGAVIAMREPAPNRRIQFDIGVAGPLAGLLVAIPVMVVGLSLSTVTTTEAFLNELPPGIETSILHEGQSLAYLGLKYLIFGEVLPQGNLDVWIHPVAFAAWAGFLVTALNLLPIGQLDGGHVMYGLFGKRAELARIPVIGVLALLAAAGSLRDAGVIDLGFGWSGWWLWILMMLFLLRRHAPVLDEITGLDAKRKALGVAVLVIFILIFTPTPLVIDAPSVAALLRWLA